VLLEQYSKDFGDGDDIFKTMLEKEKESRTIRITGKNVDELDLEKVAKLIEQANEKGFSSIRKVLRNFKKSTSNNSPVKSSTT
jgi:hypothetical protein